MKTVFVCLVAAFCLLLTAPTLQAHHGGGGAGRALLEQSISDRLNPPSTNIFFTFEANHIDDGVGNFFLYKLDGEYALLERFSVGARLPFWTVRQDFAPNNTRIGDVALTLKGELWRSLEKRMNLLMGLDTSFPTGNDQESLGAGAVALVPYFTFNKDFEVFQLFTSLLASFEAAGTVNPTVAYELGLVFPVIKGALPLDLLISYQGETTIVSDTFERGSTKGYLVPGILLELTENWEAAFLGRISVVDRLTLMENIATKDFVTSFFSDIQASFIFNLGYSF